MRSFILIFLCLLGTTGFGKVIIIDKDLPYSGLGKSISYYQDYTGKLALKDMIRNSYLRQFKHAGEDILNLGNTKAVSWIKLSYRNQTAEKAYLVLDIPTIESIDLYTDNGKGGFTQIHSGSLAAANPGVIASGNYIFDLPDPTDPSIIQDVYLRLQTNNLLIVPLKIATANQLFKGLSSGERFEALYTGILIALFFFNLAVAISSKDKSYIFYSVYVLLLSVYIVLYFNGYAYFFGAGAREFINRYPHLFLGGGNIAGLAFAYSFLNLRQVYPSARRILSYLMGTWLIVIIASILGFKSAAGNIAQLVSWVNIPLVWLLGVIAYRRGYKPAVYYIIARSFLFLTAVWLSLNLANVFPYNELSFSIFPLGFIFELLLLSLALGNRLKNLSRETAAVQAEKLKIQADNLFLAGNQNEQLERVVASRTKALRKTVASLEAANADKNRLFSIIAHDLRSPFNSLMSLFSLNDMDVLTFDDVKMLLNDSRKNIDNIHNTLNNLLYWAQSQMQGITTAPSRFNMRIMVEELMLVYQPLITKKKIKTKVLVNDDMDVYADLNQINLVMRNLIDNAIKFTPVGGFIHIKVWGTATQIYFEVCNPITGKLNIKDLDHTKAGKTSYGTSNERGIGLGLHLCRDFVARNKGLLKVSKENDCVVLRFNLPKHMNEAAAKPLLVT